MNIPINNPKKLYKYRTFDKDGYYKSLIKNNELFFSSPDRFNDPFDCEANLVIKAKDMITMAEAFYQIYKIPEFLPESIKKKLQSHREIDSESYKKSLNFHGICCFATKYDNLLMWANYADNHSGFCVELDVKIINYFISQSSNSENDKKILGLRKVNYCNKYPVIKKILNMNKAIRPALQKHPDWSYEDEWRMLYIYHSNEILKFPEGAITAVYFGLNCQREQEIIDLYNDKKQKPAFYKAEKSKFKYKINFSLI